MTKTAIVLSLMGLAAFGQATQSQPRQGSLRSALNLTEAQVSQLREARRAQAESLRPLREQMREKSRALREALRAESPDPTRVGQLMVERKNLQAQVRSTRPDRLKVLRSVLTPEQLTKLDQLKANRSRGFSGRSRNRMQRPIL